MGTPLDLAGIKTHVRAHFGGRTDFDARLTELANIAQVRLARDHDFEELKARTILAPAFTGVLAIDKFLAIASTIKEVYSLSLIDSDMGYGMTQIAGRKFEKSIPRPEEWTTGRSTIFRRWGSDNLELWRIPDKIYTYPMLHANWPTILTADTDLLSITNKDDLIILLVCAWLSVEIDRPDRANYFFAIFKREYDNAVGEDERKPDLDIAGYKHAQRADIQYWLNPFDMETHSE